MREIDVKDFRDFYGSPVFGVIGATVPSAGYNAEMGIQVGCALRKHVESNGGSIFTGGVPGVGVDVYTGVMKYCVDEAIKTGKPKEDRFFVLIPSHAPAEPGAAFLIEPLATSVAYQPPGEYEVLGRLNTQSQLSAVRAGSSMDERRDYVASVADKLVALNGGFGTLDEAINALREGKVVITLASSGGSAKLLADIKEGILSTAEQRELERVKLNTDGLNLSLIHCADSVDQIIHYL